MNQQETHMFCQVVYSKDFKAMFANKKYLLGLSEGMVLVRKQENAS